MDETADQKSPETEPLRYPFSIMNMLAKSLEITAREGLAAQHEATHDELTGLFNLKGLIEKYDELDKSNPGDFSLVAMDVDGLKMINDTQGHPAGNEHLKKVGKSLQGSIRVSHNPEFPERDLDIAAICRNGGDEFTFLLRHVSDRKTLDNVIESIRHRLESNGVRASFGGSIHREGIDYETLQAEADALLYGDKDTRKGRTRA